MIRRINDLRVYFYYVAIFLIVIAFNIFPQDNTNNMMQDKTNESTTDLDRKIEKDANYYTYNLKPKLNLTESQMRHIYEIILSNYLNISGNQTRQRAALRESRKSSDIERDPLIYGSTDNETDENNEDFYLNTDNRANKEIENILDNDQIGKWSKIKDSWWVNVKTELYQGDQDITMRKEINEKKGEYEDNRDYENFDVYDPGYDFK
jgi:hypothetical protein